MTTSNRPEDEPPAQALLAEASARLVELANPDKAVPMAAYMKTDMPFYGVQKPGRLKVFKKLRFEFAPGDAAEYEAGVLALWSGAHREEKYLALTYARAYKPFITLDALPLYERLIREGAWWDFVDEVAVYLVGQVLLEHRDALPPVMDRWIDDPDLWIRRTAIISQIKHRTETDQDRLFRYCLERAHEKEFFIRKAIGWALREHSKTEPGGVEHFLTQNRKALSGLSFREAMKVIGRARASGPAE